MKINIFENSNVVALMSEKMDGSMRLHGHAEYDKPASDNRKAYFVKHGINPERVIGAALVHGNHVEIVSRPRNPKLVWNDYLVERTDSLITGDKGICLAITAADCSPVYLWDPVQGVIALVHSGWKGTLAAVVPHTIERMVEEFNCSPPDIQAYIGPGIQKCQFQVGREIAERFPHQFVEERVLQVPLSAAIQAKESDTTNDTHERVKKYYVDLPAVIDWQLKGRGISKIACETMCTFCNKGIATLNAPPQKSEIAYRWFSFRREKSDPLKTQMAVFGMK